MRRNRISFYFLLSFVLVFTSCLKDDSTTTVYPSDAAITAFTLGTLKQYITTKAKSGADSTYSKNVTGSKYKCYIDQINHTIYNPDSLPHGTDVSHVVCTTTSKNSGTIVIKKVNSDTLVYHNNSDSIDFTTPRTFRVISRDGSNYADYTVSINVHKQLPDTLLWGNIASNQDFAEAEGMKALACNGKVFVVTSKGLNSTICYTDENDGTNWSRVGWNLNMPVPADAYKNIVVKNGNLYLYCSNSIIRSADGNNWEKTANVHLNQLIAAQGNTLYAFDVQGRLVSSDDEGITWRIETLDSDASLLPTQNLSYGIIPSATNSDTETLVIIGNRDVESYPNDTQAQVWSKLIEGENNNATWMYVSTNDLPHLQLPRLSSINAVALGKKLLATGGDGLGACHVTGFSHLYTSLDGGIYWQQSAGLYLPAKFECGQAFTMTTDSQDRIWMFCGGNGNVWRGYSTFESEKANPSSITK